MSHLFSRAVGAAPKEAPPPAEPPRAAAAAAAGATAAPPPPRRLTRAGAAFLAALPGFLYYAVPVAVMPAATLASVLLGARLRSAAAALLTVVYAFVVMPVLDWALGDDPRNAPTGPAWLEAAAAHRALLHAYAVVHVAVVATAVRVLPAALAAGLPARVAVAATFSVGVSGGIMFVVAHELLHSRRAADRAVSLALLSTAGYAHWSVSHLQHHVKVATPDDPATARLGESFYAFFPRTVAGAFRDAHAAEAARLARLRASALDPRRSRAFWWAAAPAALAAAAYAAAGAAGVAVLAGQAAGAVLMLEVVNYIEHAGLARRDLAAGSSSPSSSAAAASPPLPSSSAAAGPRWERVRPCHSYNAPSVYTNAVAFRLARHSDHHASEAKPYQRLRDVGPGAAAELPAGYPAMMLLALAPPLFWRVMRPVAARAAAMA